MNNQAGVTVMRPNQILRVLTLVLAASWICLESSPLQAQTSNANCGEKLLRLLKETGHTYTRHNEITYSIDFDRKSIGKFKVIVSCGSDMVISFVVLAKKAAIQKTPRMMEILLLANHEYDYTKTVIDNDGDLGVRIDSRLNMLDGAQLKSDIAQLANASDEIFSKISAFIKR